MVAVTRVVVTKVVVAKVAVAAVVPMAADKRLASPLPGTSDGRMPTSARLMRTSAAQKAAGMPSPKRQSLCRRDPSASRPVQDVETDALPQCPEGERPALLRRPPLPCGVTVGPGTRSHTCRCLGRQMCRHHNRKIPDLRAERAAAVEQAAAETAVVVKAAAAKDAAAEVVVEGEAVKRAAE
eukprot:5794416-Prymnesium_polylepis.1